MKFGNCKVCREYKYLEEKATCVSCLDDSEDWMVVELHGLYAPREVITQKGLSKKEAKDIAKENSMTRAVREDKFER